MPIGSGSEGLLYLPCEQMTQPEAIAAALVLMQAAQLLPGQTRNVAEPTAGPNAATASADTDEDGRVCVAGLGPCALLLKATSEHRPPCVPHGSEEPGADDDVTRLSID